MFRRMRRFKQQLSDQESIEILKNGEYGILSVHGDNGYPYSIPLNYTYVDNSIIIHCAKTGHKIDAIKNNNKVSFCVIGKNIIVPEKYNTLFTSVIVFGKAEIINNKEDLMNYIKILGNKFYPNHDKELDAEIKKDFNALSMIKITPIHITGKQSIEFLKKN